MANLWDPVIVFATERADYWNNQTRLGDTQMVSLAAGQVCGSVMEIRYARQVAAGVREDLAINTLHFSVEAGPGAPMSKLDASDAARLEVAWGTGYFNNMKTYLADDWSVKEIAWRHFGADFPLDKNGFSKPGPYWRINPQALAGTTGSARLPDQVALTTTFRTGSRKHWGRYYQGGFGTTSLLDAQFGHAVDAVVTQQASAFRGFLNDIYDDARKTTLWVWSPKYLGACSVNELSVDNTFDVVRRRRAKFPTFRATHTS